MTTPAAQGNGREWHDSKLDLLLAWYEELPHARRREFWQLRGTAAGKIAWLMGEAMQVKRKQMEVIQ